MTDNDTNPSLEISITDAPAPSPAPSKLKKALDRALKVFPWLLGIVGAIVAAILMRPKPKPGGVVGTPDRPVLNPVDVSGVKTDPSTTYTENKTQPMSDPSSVVNGLNQRYGGGGGGGGGTEM